MKHPKFILAMILLCIQLACRAPDGPAREDEGTRVPGCPVHAQPKTSLGFGWPDVVFNSEEMKLDREYGRTVKLSANVFLENGRVVVLLRNVGQGDETVLFDDAGMGLNAILDPGLKRWAVPLESPPPKLNGDISGNPIHFPGGKRILKPGETMRLETDPKLYWTFYADNPVFPDSMKPVMNMKPVFSPRGYPIAPADEYVLALFLQAPHGLFLQFAIFWKGPVRI